MPQPKAIKPILLRALIFPPLLLAAFALMLLWQINRLLLINERVRHTNEVIAKAHQNLKLLIDGETGVRGYVITGNQTFLEPYNQSLNSTGSAFAKLEVLVADNKTQHQRVTD